MSVITIDTSALGLGAKQLAAMSKQVSDVVDDVLTANIIEMEEKAKQLAPADRGAAGIRGHISAKTDKYLVKELTSNMPYSAFMEFGTGMYAAQYVSSLPSEWQQFAQQFKGDKGKMSIKGILFVLQGWFHRHGIDKQHAYFIARKIFINGVKQHPFLYPAFDKQKRQLKEDIENAIKALIK